MVLHGITVSASTPPLKPRLTRCGASWAQTNLRTRKSKLPRRSRTCPVIVALQIHGHHRQGYQSQRHLAYAIDLDVALQVPAACPAACIHCPSNRALDRNFPPHWVLSICCPFVVTVFLRIFRVVVSIPIDLSSPEDADLAKLEEKGVKGRYVSVEQLAELENGNTEWRMATSSTPGGLIPSFLTESTMNSTIAEVRSSFFLENVHALKLVSRMCLIS